MLTIFFIIFKITGIVHASWWWIIPFLLIDDEILVFKKHKQIKKVIIENVYQRLNKEYPYVLIEKNVKEIINKYGYDIDESFIINKMGLTLFLQGKNSEKISKTKTR